jgi:RHS repeat-associated protein
VNYYYDLGSRPIDELSSTGIWNRGEVYAGGRHLATYSGGTSGALYFIHADWLGTERSRVTYAGAPYETCTSLAFGDSLSCTGVDSGPLHFTSKERDAESGLDNFGARFYASSMARFASRDTGPYIWKDPQTLNRYTYTRNNPLKFIDPTGKYFVVTGSDGFRQQVQNYISSLARNETGRATVDSVAKSPKPTVIQEGTLPRTQNGNTISVTNATTQLQAGSAPGGASGATITLDNSNITFVAEKRQQNPFQVGLTAFDHELNHDVAALAARTLQGAAAAAAAGDAPTAPGANNTAGGSAEATALSIVTALGEAGTDFVPDAAYASYAAGILQSGDNQDYQQRVNQRWEEYQEGQENESPL